MVLFVADLILSLIWNGICYTQCFIFALCSGLRQEVAKSRFHQQQFADKKQCTICEIGFTAILRTGAKCPLCGNQVCKKCRYFPPKPLPNFKRTVCHKEKWVNHWHCLSIYKDSVEYKLTIVGASFLVSCNHLLCTKMSVWLLLVL